MDKKHTYNLNEKIGTAVLFAIPLLGMFAMALPIDLREQLYLHLELTKQGEYWRIVSGHFIYVSWLHWLLNTIGVFILLALLRDGQCLGNWMIAMVFIMVAISAGLLLFSEQLSWYAGFSGILTGLFAFTAVHTFTKRRIFSIGILLILTIYVLNQLWGGELVSGSLISIRSSSYAHALGLCAGIIYAVLDLIIKKRI